MPIDADVQPLLDAKADKAALAALQNEVNMLKTHQHSGIYAAAGHTHDVEVAIPLSGTIGGTLAAGTVHRIVGNAVLISDLVVEGILTGVDTFEVDGAGFQILVQNGGRVILEGVEKSAWVHWGDATTGWEIGDRLVVAPTAIGVYVPTETVWRGSWGATTRPANSPDVTLIDATVAKPEVANLSQTILLHNLRRIHFHAGAGVQTFKWMKVLNSGITGVLGDYPLHFHLNGEASRGSLHEGVVVEGGKNHAFVAHGSHGITYNNCVAYRTTNIAYWWDQPGADTVNDSNDITWQSCLALVATQPPNTSNDHRFAAFLIGRGSRNRCLDSVAVGVEGIGKNMSAFKWPENAVWEFDRCVGHNTKGSGIFTWVNSSERHIIDNFKAYNYKRAGIEHGAYLTAFAYRDCVLQTGVRVGSGSQETFGVLQHSNARSPDLLFENIQTNDQMVVESHGLPPAGWVIHRNCDYGPDSTQPIGFPIKYQELKGVGTDPNTTPSRNRYEDCAANGHLLGPADFDFSVGSGGRGISAQSKIEIWHGGILTDEWIRGSWT